MTSAWNAALTNSSTSPRLHRVREISGRVGPVRLERDERDLALLASRPGLEADQLAARVGHEIDAAAVAEHLELLDVARQVPRRLDEADPVIGIRGDDGGGRRHLVDVAPCVRADGVDRRRHAQVPAHPRGAVGTEIEQHAAAPLGAVEHRPERAAAGGARGSSPARQSRPGQPPAGPIPARPTCRSACRAATRPAPRPAVPADRVHAPDGAELARRRQLRRGVVGRPPWRLRVDHDLDAARLGDVANRDGIGMRRRHRLLEHHRDAALRTVLRDRRACWWLSTNDQTPSGFTSSSRRRWSS